MVGEEELLYDDMNFASLQPYLMDYEAGDDGEWIEKDNIKRWKTMNSYWRQGGENLTYDGAGEEWE